MTFIPKQVKKSCFIACSQSKVDAGLCDCVNRMRNEASLHQQPLLKREKISLGGYEMWLDRSRYPLLLIYDSEKAKNGMLVDIMGSGNNIWAVSTALTQEEKKQLVDFLKSKSKN